MSIVLYRVFVKVEGFEKRQSVMVTAESRNHAKELAMRHFADLGNEATRAEIFDVWDIDRNQVVTWEGDAP